MGSSRSRAKKGGRGKPAHLKVVPPVKPTTKYDDWVWWPDDPKRRARAEEEFFALPEQVQGEMLTRIKRLLDGETRFKDVDDLGDGIKELRYRVGNNQFRILFGTDGRIACGLTCFYKNQRKTDPQDIARAKKRLDSWGGARK